MITNPKFVTIYVSDQGQAREFFTETLGCDLLTDAPFGDSGDRWIEVGFPGAQTYLVLAPADPHVRDTIRERLGSMSYVWFSTDDLDRTHAELVEKGVEFPVAPQAAPWDPTGTTRWAQFTDPDGNVYGVSQDG